MPDCSEIMIISYPKHQHSMVCSTDPVIGRSIAASERRFSIITCAKRSAVSDHGSVVIAAPSRGQIVASEYINSLHVDPVSEFRRTDTILSYLVG